VQPGRAADHSPPSSAAVMEEQSYTFTHPLGHTGPVTGTLYLYFTLLVNQTNHLTHYCIVYRMKLRTHADAFQASRDLPQGETYYSLNVVSFHRLKSLL